MIRRPLHNNLFTLAAKAILGVSTRRSSGAAEKSSNWPPKRLALAFGWNT